VTKEGAVVRVETADSLQEQQVIEAPSHLGLANKQTHPGEKPDVHIGSWKLGDFVEGSFQPNIPRLDVLEHVAAVGLDEKVGRPPQAFHDPEVPCFLFENPW